MSWQANPQPEYPQNTHMLDHTSKKEHVLRWVQDNVARDGGRATFVGFGRSAPHMFGKVQAMLPDEYETMIRPFKDENNSFRRDRHEVQLRVTHENAPWPPQAVHPIYSENPERQVGDFTQGGRPTS